MKTPITDKDIALLNAQRKVTKIKQFYKHLTVYILVNIFLTLLSISNDVNGGKTIQEAFVEFDNFNLWFFWGIGVVLHALRTFNYLNVFSKDWEERKIKEYMNK